MTHDASKDPQRGPRNTAVASVSAVATGLVATPDTSVDSAAGSMVFVFSLVALLIIAGIIVWKSRSTRR